MQNLVAALVAQRFYVDGRTKKEIGDELGISRFKVARILDQAVAEGIVSIRIAAPAEVDLELSHRVAERFALKQALVVHPGVESSEVMGRATVALLSERLTDADVLGISWGRTLHALTDVLPALPAAEVVQMVGSVPSADLALNPLALLGRLGESTRGTVHALHVPMVLDDAAVAEALRQSDHVKNTLAQFDRLTIALIGIGAWAPGGSSLRDALPPGLVSSMTGAVADMCSTVVDASGEVVGGDTVPSHCISITTEQLRRVPDVIALAGGAAKAPAIAAALRTGIVHRLITDEAAATALLAR